MFHGTDNILQRISYTQTIVNPMEHYRSLQAVSSKKSSKNRK